MAIKDWKKHTGKVWQGTYFVYFHKSKDLAVSLQDSTGGEREKFVVYYGDKDNASSEGFKTKPKALKFAMDYMRDN